MKYVIRGGIDQIYRILSRYLNVGIVIFRSEAELISTLDGCNSVSSILGEGEVRGNDMCEYFFVDV
ncbi:hypothetical protein [Bacillus sp. SH5-2]|uniref:hypothetical protein n=1 Tax=Bacillus sp. SH5-2 TaxID=2217834 RepID=UPI0011EEEBBA|nr:hypothetical protein [Bacillus sp. SH5-2]KAA0766302.1 hypothetical protein DN410_03655 [Bacillus sp. SH5-2]